MKKTISILLIILMILCFCNPISNAAWYDEDPEPISNMVTPESENNIGSYIGNGTVTTSGDEESQTTTTNPGSGALNGITTFICKGLVLIPKLGSIVLSFIAYGKIGETFTIQKLLSNEYGLTDINFFKDLDSSVRYAKTINTIKNSVAVWYVSIRNVSAVAIALILIYVAIRMAISTVADEKARYKKMCLFWFEAIILLFVLHYIVIIALNVSEKVNELLIKGMDVVTDSSGKKESMEEALVENAWKNLDAAEGAANTVVCFVLYTMMIYYEVKFFIMYLSRVLRVAFYMVIAPFVCVTYCIDKIGDGRAQAFRNWLTEMMMEIFMQTMHLAIYIVFIYSAGAIIETSPFLGVVFLAALGNAEKIIRSLLKVKPQFAKGISETKLPGQ